ncbi:PDZ domain-containing protein [Luteolibacter flavescens]|uniref:PDZ domain-containing protein n=1 Tax=Luteolibacter flavescens TaxID=1859460 RepID=A0ABT3FIE3_9BACT|nr:PDZ domain-containing protein [Luteolibacter flavescens]MCW1883337.1 PDZ domain-containing protein [Luteolibacter flavescens]
MGIALSGSAFADEAAKNHASPTQLIQGVSDTPWLGLTVGRLDDAVRAHVRDLPQGIGFVVTDVAAGSPAEKAGVKAYDVFWKFGDQLIANEAQLLTLLRLKKDGDKVDLSIYRSGESLVIPVTLSKQAEDPPHGQLSSRNAASPDTPMKVLNPADRTAAIETPDGKAVLSLVNGQSEVKITSKTGSVIFQGPTKDAQGVSLVPDPWKPRVGALERALAHAVKGSRPPRMRVLTASEDQN